MKNQTEILGTEADNLVEQMLPQLDMDLLIIPGTSLCGQNSPEQLDVTTTYCLDQLTVGQVKLQIRKFHQRVIDLVKETDKKN